jgi:hypothetical protein
MDLTLKEREQSKYLSFLSNLRSLGKMGYKIKDLKDSSNDAGILNDLILLDEYLNRKDKKEEIELMRQIIHG